VWSELKTLFGRPSSREEAKNRLHLVLAHDRTGLDGAKLVEMRSEIAALLARYVEIDDDALEIEVHRVSRENTQLKVSSPLRPR
jgi:cell division topological specificity factor